MKIYNIISKDRMKHIIAYISILAPIILSSCADDIVNNEDIDSLITTDSIKTESTGGVWASMPEFIDGNSSNEGSSANDVTRSNLIYDRTNKNMTFSWENSSEDYMCVFALDGKDNVVPQLFNRIGGQDAATLNCRFQTPEGARALTQKDKNGINIEYISFRPYPDQTKELNYKTKSVSYEGQTQTANAKMKLYYAASDATDETTKTEKYADYDQSEKKASAHLGAYDYLASEAQTTDDEGGIEFKLKRLGAVVRFNIKNPAQEIFDELQLVAQGGPLFTLEGTADLGERTITATKSSNVMVLKFGNGGIDMTDTSSDYYDYYNYKYNGYIIAYMMLAPVDLSGDATTINLYLVSHEKGSTVKKCYKSEDLSKPNLTANKFYRWTPVMDNVDTPITFSEITVQQWKDETAINNGDGGTGTIGW